MKPGLPQRSPRHAIRGKSDPQARKGKRSIAEINDETWKSGPFQDHFHLDLLESLGDWHIYTHIYIYKYNIIVYYSIYNITKIICIIICVCVSHWPLLSPFFTDWSVNFIQFFNAVSHLWDDSARWSCTRTMKLISCCLDGGTQWYPVLPGIPGKDTYD